MKTISNNRYLDALLKLLLGAAIVHIVILITAVILFHDLLIVNIVNVLGFDWFFPQFGSTGINNYLSVFIWIIIYLVIFFFFTNKIRK